MPSLDLMAGLDIGTATKVPLPYAIEFHVELTGKVLCVITSPSAEMTEVVPLESENRRRWQ